MSYKPLIAAAVFTSFSILIGCNLESPPVFDPRAMQENERIRSAELEPSDLEALPTTRVDPYGSASTSEPSGQGDVISRPSTGPDLDNEPIVRLSLREIIARAVANNHDVRVAGFQPGIEGARVIEDWGNFDPTFFTNVTYQHKDELNGGNIYNTFNGLGLVTTNILHSDTAQIQTGVQENLDSGGQIQLQYENSYNWLSPQQSVDNPFYENDLTLQITQPLLKNFGYDVNHARIVIDRLNEKVDLQEFRKAVEKNASDIEQAYWQLMQAERYVEIENDLVNNTLGEWKVLNDRMQNGGLDVSDLQVQQAASALETRRGQLVQYKAQVRDLSYKLKALMSDPDFPVASSILILPADDPVETPMVFDLQDQINTAMSNRFELGEQQLKIAEATETMAVARNNLLPELDLTGSVGPQGAGPDEGSAIRTGAEFQHIDDSIGFKLQIPLGNRSARGIWTRSVLQRMQAIEQYSAYVETVCSDVTTAADAVDTSYRLIDSSRRARLDAQQAMDDINQREQANEPLTPEFVELKLDRQELLAQSLQAEAQALANYNIALAQLEKAKGTLLRYNNVVMKEDITHPEENGLLH